MYLRSRSTALRGFTLIELLVVVAIIALLISILLPSLNKSRAQARTSLCASRMSQLTKALFMYGDDNNELLPFHVTYGAEPAWGGGGRPDVSTLDPNEDWIASKEQMPKVFLTPERDWESLGVNLPRSGCLFNYARFKSLYACPDFERKPENGVASIKFDTDGPGEQTAFNYTRGPWCRRPDFQITPSLLLNFNGPIMTPSRAYATGQAILLLDEAWYAHVGKGRSADPGSYRACDPVWDISSSLGLYHGAGVVGDVLKKISGSSFELARNVAVRRANVSAYDGHVELYRDPCPLVNSDSGRGIIQVVMLGGNDILKMMSNVVYALTGKMFQFN